MTAKEVKVYSTPTCPWCKKVKASLEGNGIEYQDYNVAEDSAAREELMNKYHQMSVPVTSIGDEVVVGFDEPKLKEKLGL